MQFNIPELIARAKKVADKAQAKYSNFPVGAALLSTDNRIITGCNVESSSYGLSICAERVALVKALSEGITDFHTMVIYAEKAEYCPPCGACRQLLFDYAPKIKIILTNGKEYQSYKLKDLLPHAFEASKLSDK